MGSALWSAFILTLFWNPFHPSLPVNMSETSTSSSHPVCTSSVQHQSTCCTSPCQRLGSLLSPTSNAGKLVDRTKQPSPAAPTQPCPTLLNPTPPSIRGCIALAQPEAFKLLEQPVYLVRHSIRKPAAQTATPPMIAVQEGSTAVPAGGALLGAGALWVLLVLFSCGAPLCSGRIQPSASPLLLPHALPSGCAALTCRLFSIAMKAENLS